MFAVPFDLERLEIRGSPVPVLEQVGYSTLTGSAMFDFSDAGTLVYHSGGAAANGLRTVQWLDGTNKMQPLLAKPDGYVYPRLSADGERVAFYMIDVWVYEGRRDTMTRLTFEGGIEPTWSPDGRYIVYSKPGEGMFWTRSDGAGKPQRLTQSKNAQHPNSFSPDGKRLAFGESSGDSGYDLFTVPIESDGSLLRAGKPEPFLRTQFNERQPSFSADGHWLAYASDESGINQVYVRAFPDNGSRWQISNGGGVEPHFSRTGHELFFRTEGGQMVLVANYMVKGDSFVADKPRLWSAKSILASGTTSSYDVASDGKRIAALMPAETPEAQQALNHVIFLENFFDELRRKVPQNRK